MNRSEFKSLFERVISEAIDKTKARVDETISPNVMIEIHGAGHTGDIVSVNQAFESIYLGDELYWRIIDVAVKSIELNQTLVFVRVSGHKPTSFEETWNDPKGYGPFKPS